MRASVSNNSGQPQPLVIAWNYFPGWKGRFKHSDKPLTILPQPGTGLIRVEAIPPGHSEICVWFGNTPLRRTCKTISATAWLLWVVAWIGLAAMAYRNARKTASGESA